MCVLCVLCVFSPSISTIFHWKSYLARYKPENVQICFWCFSCLFVFFLHSNFLNWFVFYVFLVFFLSSPPNFSCYVFSVFSFFLFQIAFSSIFSPCFFSPSKVSFLYTYSMMPFFVFSLFIFWQPFFLLILFLFLVFLWAILLFWLLNTFLVLSSKFCSLVSRRCFPLCRILFYYVMEQLFLIATRGIFTSFRIQPNQIEEISPSFLFLLFNGMTNPPAIAFYTKLH